MVHNAVFIRVVSLIQQVFKNGNALFVGVKNDLAVVYSVCSGAVLYCRKVALWLILDILIVRNLQFLVKIL